MYEIAIILPLIGAISSLAGLVGKAIDAGSEPEKPKHTPTPWQLGPSLFKPMAPPQVDVTPMAPAAAASPIALPQQAPPPSPWGDDDEEERKRRAAMQQAPQFGPAVSGFFGGGGMV